MLDSMTPCVLVVCFLTRRPGLEADVSSAVTLSAMLSCLYDKKATLYHLQNHCLSSVERMFAGCLVDSCVVRAITQSTGIIYRKDNRRHPCRTAVSMLKSSVRQPPRAAWQVEGSYASRISLMMSSGIPLCCSSFHKMFCERCQGLQNK